jgi:uncharacterized protein (DUF1810 family)
MPDSRNSSLLIDPHDLERFVRAQSADYDRALAELRGGRKQSHWMWYIFPQFAGLGYSAMAARYAIESVAGARSYLDHPVLGRRLHECAEAVLGVVGRSATEIMGSPDDLKLRSSATLFARVSQHTVFAELLTKYYDGRPDEETVRLMDAAAGQG